MSVWIANGTHLAWLIDPVDEVESYLLFRRICRHNARIWKKNVKPVEGFELDLSLLQ